MMRRFVILATAGLLAACGNGLAARQAELSKWVGQPETALVQAMGVPTRVYETDNMKFLSYDEQRVEIVPGSPFYYGPEPFWYGGGFPPSVVNLGCDTTFTIAGGVVRSFTLHGNACG